DAEMEISVASVTRSRDDQRRAPGPRGGSSVRPVDRVRGTRDVLPGEYEASQRLVATLSRNATAHGYQFIDSPVLEHTELFLRKSGGDRIAQLYSFNHRGRDLALRPEFTASV